MIDPHLSTLSYPPSPPKAQKKITHLFPHLPSNMGQPFLAIEALGFQSSIPEHLCHLSVLLTIFLEYELTLVIVILVLSSSTILSSLRSIITLVSIKMM